LTTRQRLGATRTMAPACYRADNMMGWLARVHVASGLLLGAAVPGACTPPAAPARYAGWEPMPAGVPSASSRGVAQERLAQSRAL